MARCADRKRFVYSRLKENLFSVSACGKKGFEVNFDDNRVSVMLNKEVVASGVRQSNDLYRMFFRIVKTSVEEANVVQFNLRVWHERLGHVDKREIREFVKKGCIGCLEWSYIKF